MLKKVFIPRDKVIFETAQTVYWVEDNTVWKAKSGSKEARANQSVLVIKSSIEKVETHYAYSDNIGTKLVKILKRYKVKIQRHKSKVKA